MVSRNEKPDKREGLYDNIGQFRNLYESMQEDCLLLDPSWRKFVGHAVLGVTGLGVFVYSMVKCYQHVRDNQRRHKSLKRPRSDDDDELREEDKTESRFQRSKRRRIPTVVIKEIVDDDNLLSRS